MSREELQRFCQVAQQDSELLNQFQSCNNEEGLVTLVVDLGRQNSFDITEDDVRQAIEEARAQQEVTYPIEDLSRVSTY